MQENMHNIPGYNTWLSLTPLQKGWSRDEKYIIQTRQNGKNLLRISPVQEIEAKQKDYETLLTIQHLHIQMSRPLAFGLLDDGRPYTLLTWLEGSDVESQLPLLSENEQYHLGWLAGEALAELHSSPAPPNQSPWQERFQRKTEAKLENYSNCPIKIPGGEAIVDYITNNFRLLQNRPQCFQHGDYHCGNLIVTPEHQIGIIDFNRLDYGDPFEEFNRIVWCATVSPRFASGRIDGYFQGKVPVEFFPLLAFYIGSNQLSSIPWAIPFGKEQIQVLQKQGEDVLKWYKNFSTVIPTWYSAGYQTQ
ncbi:MAG TPA: phosphotransferase [Bacillota bacterium]|nr:phosphotransferase [Bacillota bacterium]